MTVKIMIVISPFSAGQEAAININSVNAIAYLLSSRKNISKHQSEALSVRKSRRVPSAWGYNEKGCFRVCH